MLEGKDTLIGIKIRTILLRFCPIVTVDSKTIRALAIILPIFLWFDGRFLSSLLVIHSIKPKDLDLANIYFIKLH